MGSEMCIRDRVSSERRGTYVWYRINPEALGALSALLAVPTPA